MAVRDAKLIFLVGTNGTGKSTQMLKFLNLSHRNLIIPSNSLDKRWEPVEALKMKIVNKGTKLEERYFPELNTFGRKGFPVVRKAALTKRTIHMILGEPDEDPHRCFIDGTLFLDDFKNYIPSRGVLPDMVLNLLSQRRHRQLDIIAAGHSFQYINPEIFAYNPEFIIFKTTQPLSNQLKEKVANLSEFEETIKRVNQKAVTNPYYCERFIPDNS